MKLDDESTWPAEIVRFIGMNQELFDDWYGPTAESRDRRRRPGEHWIGPRFSGRDHDQAVNQFLRLLVPHTLESGFHCTRLTQKEIESIRGGGMQLQNSKTLRARIADLKSVGLIDNGVATIFSDLNSADDDNRAAMIWFCFFSPHRAGEGGIERLLRYWGGEALHRWHEDGTETSSLLKRIGTPSVVVADVPIRLLEKGSSLVETLVRLYFENRGLRTAQSIRYETFTRFPLPAEAIRRVVSFPDAEFLDLTGCSSWRRTLE
jgi:hypothetical protein